MTLRSAADADLDWIAALQRRPEVAEYVYADDVPALRAACTDPDERLLIWGMPRAGFAMLRRCAGADRVVDLRRIPVETPGRGEGARFLAALVDFVFGALGASRFWFDVFEGNDRAERAYRRAGFIREGMLREHAIRQSGGYGSLVLMGMLRREWQARR